MCRSLSLRPLLRRCSLRLEAGLVTLVNDDRAAQIAVLQLRPAPARQRRAVRAVVTFPGPLDGRLPVPCSRSPVHESSNVAELEVADAVFLELDERLDFF